MKTLLLGATSCPFSGQLCFLLLIFKECSQLVLVILCACLFLFFVLLGEKPCTGHSVGGCEASVSLWQLF